MKRSKLGRLKPAAIVAVGVVLGRGAQAGTILTFDALPPGQAHNQPIIQTFGDNATAPSPGVSVFGGGTPDINLTWSAAGSVGVARWDYYIDSVWSAGQLNDAGVGNTYDLLFAPGAAAAVSVGSFNFHPYYNSGTTYDFNWSVLDGVTVLTSGSLSFTSDATKNHAVNVNYTGAVGEALTLRLSRTGGTGRDDSIALDDITFAQVPEPSVLALLSSGGLAWIALYARRRRSCADRRT
jgi:hypothetical protein